MLSTFRAKILRSERVKEHWFNPGNHILGKKYGIHGQVFLEDYIPEFLEDTVSLTNQFVPNAPFLYPLKTSENPGGSVKVHSEEMGLKIQ